MPGNTIDNGSTARIPLYCVLLSDHITPATGKTVAVTISKNGAAFGNPSSGATNATEIGSGWYYFTPSATDTGTNGPLIVLGTNAATDNSTRDYMVAAAAPTAASVATAVWNEVNTGATHNVGNSTGKQLRSISVNTGVIYTATAPSQAGMTSTQIKLDSGASAVNNVYQWTVISILSGTDAGDSAIITAYDGATKIATVDPPWAVQPDATSVFEITPTPRVQTVGSSTANITSVNGTTFSGANVPSILADGVAHGGTPGSSTATFAGKKWNLTNPDGDNAFHVECTAGGSGIAAIGFGSDPGVQFVGGDSGSGLRLMAPGSGQGLSIITSGAGDGVNIISTSGTGIAVQQGGFSVSGSLSITNSTGSSALILRATSGNTPAVSVQGNGSGAGILTTGGATGIGFSCVGQGSGAGFKALGGSTGSGILAQGIDRAAMTLNSNTSDGLSINAGNDGIRILGPGGHGINIQTSGTDTHCLSMDADSGHAVSITATGAGTKALLLAGDAATDSFAIMPIGGSLIDIFDATGAVRTTGGGGGSATLDLTQALSTPRDLGSVADGSLTLNDALHCAVAGAAGKQSISGTTYLVQTPSTGTTLRSFTLDSGTAPRTRS